MNPAIGNDQDEKGLELDDMDLFNDSSDVFNGKDSLLTDSLIDLLDVEDPSNMSFGLAEFPQDMLVGPPKVRQSQKKRPSLTGSDQVNAHLEKGFVQSAELVFLCCKGFCCLFCVFLVIGIFFPSSGLHAVPASVANSMDFSVDPCEDFYQYACGGWMHHTPVSNMTLSPFTQVQDRIMSQMSKIITDLQSGDAVHTKWTKKLLDVHDICMKERRAEIPVPRTNDSVATRVAEYHDMGIYPYFRFHAQRNPQDNTSTLSWRASDVDPEKVREPVWRQHAENLLRLAGDSNPSQTADAALEVKRKLAGIKDGTWNFTSWDEFAKLMPNFNWTEYWTAYGVPDFKTKIGVVSFGSLEAIQAVDALFNSTNQLDYEHAELLIGASRATEALYQEEERFAKLANGAAFQPLWKRCVSYAVEHFGWVLSQKYIHQFPVATEEPTQLLHKVMNSFSMPTWMDEKTQLRANEKKSGIVVNAASPAWMHDEATFTTKMEQFYGDEDQGTTMWTVHQAQAQSTKRYMLSAIGKTKDRSWDVDSIQPTDVTAFYCPMENSMNFPYGVFGFPFMVSSKYHPNALNWGSLGFLVGRELFRAFDEKGRNYDKDGQHSPWWDAETLNKYYLRQTCFETQYDALGADGRQTRRENIADHAGFTVAYDSFLENTQDWHGVSDGRHLSEKQLFFISYAQTLCTHHQAAENNLAYASGEVRVRGIIQNAKDFGDLFQCPPDSPMNPPEKCSLK